MESIPKHEPMTRERAHAIINRLLTESMATRIEMEETFHTDPGIQAALARLERRKKETTTPSEQL